MSAGADDVSIEVLERRLLDRYVNTASDEARAALLGTSGRAGWKTTAAARILGLWPRIKAIPVVGSAAHRVFTWFRKTGG